jgi:NCAIR mutase (PurE)-related protein
LDRERIRRLLEEVRTGHVAIDDALEILRSLPYEDLGFAKIDTHRALRTGFPEVIFCEGKTEDQIRAIAEKAPREGETLMATRATPRTYEVIREIRTEAVYHETARIVVIGPPRQKKSDARILVVSAGTSDLPTASLTTGAGFRRQT